MLGKKHIYKLLWLLLLSGVVNADIEGVFESKAAQGFELAKKHCARCHVIGDYNRLGEIGNSPSFPLWFKTVIGRSRLTLSGHLKPSKHPGESITS